MLARINDLPLRIKLYGLLLVAIGTGAASSAFLMYRAAESAAAYDRILGVEVRQEQLAKAAQLGFKVQVQEWKNVLLRGHDRDQFEKYSRQFVEQEAEVAALVTELLEDPQLDPAVQEIVEEFQAAHMEMGVAYRAAMADFELSSDPYAADAQVRGIDRAPTDLLDEVALELGVQALSESTGAALARQRMILGGLLFLIFGAVLFAAWVVVRGVTEPLAKVVAILGALSRGRVSSARIGEVKRVDEVGQLAAAAEHLARRLESNVVESLDRMAVGDLDFEVQAEEGDEITPSIVQVKGALGAMHGEMNKVIGAARSGHLKVRGDADGFQGAYYEIVAGMNGALDAFLTPVEEANRVMAELGRGELRVQMDGRYQGDFELMQASVNTLASGLRSALARIGEASDELAGASRALRGTSDSLSSAAENARGEAEGASAASSQTSANVQMVAAAAEQLSNSIGEISGQLHEAVRIAVEARARVEGSVEIMDYLGDASREIDEVVKVVTGIAEQTNLLALNATIEAARAGEAGKGFAVVASEVKQLASETSRATEGITSRVQDIQGRTGEAVASIRDISAVIDRMNQIAEGIAGAVEEQSAAVAEIAQNAGQAAQGTDEMARSVSNVTTSVNRSADDARGLLGAADDVDGRASELRELVAAYHV